LNSVHTKKIDIQLRLIAASASQYRNIA
jgi:hypothetical protein